MLHTVQVFCIHIHAFTLATRRADALFARVCQVFLVMFLPASQFVSSVCLTLRLVL